MSRAQRRRLDLRDLGRRRVTVATRSTAVAGTALAAVFGVVLAHHTSEAAVQRSSATHPDVPKPAVSTAPPVNAVPVTTAPPAPVLPQTAVTTQPPIAAAPAPIQPPAQPPAAAPGGGSSSSGGS